MNLNEKPRGVEWEQYRAVERRYWFALIGGAVCVVLLAPWFSHDLVRDVVYAICGGLLLMNVPWALHNRELICPYCGNRFYKAAWWERGPDPNTCHSCGRVRPAVW